MKLKSLIASLFTAFSNPEIKKPMTKPQIEEEQRLWRISLQRRSFADKLEQAKADMKELKPFYEEIVKKQMANYKKEKIIPYPREFRKLTFRIRE